MSFFFWNPLGSIMSLLPAWLSESTPPAPDSPPESQVSPPLRATPRPPGCPKERVVFPISYYAVAFVRDAPQENDPAPTFVFETLREVLAACKKYPTSHLRWKRFSTRAEAEKFSVLHDAEEQAAVEDTLPYDPPTADEISELRECIEAGETDEVVELIESNPRLLIGNRDNPTILDEDFGLSAFHVAAEFNRNEILKIILKRLRSSTYVRKLYPEDDDEMIRERITYIVEMYLNMPDGTEKGETALHYATKFGSVAVAELLTEQKECDQDARNSRKQGAEDVICKYEGGRCDGFRMRRLFKQEFVIPIIKSPSGSKKPHIMPPVTFKKLHRMLTLSSELSRSFYGFIGPATSLRATKIIEDIQQGWHAPENARLMKFASQSGVETFVRRIAKAHEIPFRQNWPFLGCALDITSESGLMVLDACFRKRDFIHGDRPSRPDYKVWCALKPFSAEIIDDDCYPSVERWMSDMSQFPISEMRSWRGPEKNVISPVRPEGGPDDTLIGLVKKFASDGEL